jgi:hypothetical protein
MIQLGAEEDEYLASATLAKKIRQYNENAQKLIPYLEKNTPFKMVNAEQKKE